MGEHSDDGHDLHGHNGRRLFIILVAAALTAGAVKDVFHPIEWIRTARQSVSEQRVAELEANNHALREQLRRRSEPDMSMFDRSTIKSTHTFLQNDQLPSGHRCKGQLWLSNASYVLKQNSVRTEITKAISTCGEDPPALEQSYFLMAQLDIGQAKSAGDNKQARLAFENAASTNLRQSIKHGATSSAKLVPAAALDLAALYRERTLSDTSKKELLAVKENLQLALDKLSDEDRDFDFPLRKQIRFFEKKLERPEAQPPIKRKNSARTTKTRQVKRNARAPRCEFVNYFTLDTKRDTRCAGTYSGQVASF